jgi:transposase
VSRPSKYTDEFRRDAVALYRSRSTDPGCTIAGVAKDLGVNHETLRHWIRTAETTPAAVPGGPVGGGLSGEERAELARLRKAEREWQVEREILRRAAAYFALMP